MMFALFTFKSGDTMQHELFCGCGTEKVSRGKVIFYSLILIYVCHAFKYNRMQN